MNRKSQWEADINMMRYHSKHHYITTNHSLYTIQ